jgi:tetratricopeptide (TPR) repeat protein
LLERLASALRVAPSELAGTPYLPPTSASSEAHSSIEPIRAALADYELGEPVGGEPLPWPILCERLTKASGLRPAANYAALGELLPGLIRALHLSLTGPHRRDALIGLVDCYSDAQALAKNLGAADLAQIAARHVRDAATALSGPEWSGLAAWARAQAIGSGSRDRALEVASRAADDIAGELDRPEVAEVYGSLHLVAALASTTLGRRDDAAAHLQEAADIAARPGVGKSGVGDSGFGRLVFHTGNVEVWRTTLSVEAGEGGRAVEMARAVDPSLVPTWPSRRAAWWMDIGRGLAMERGTRDEAVRAFRHAEEIAPQRVRANPFVREVVTDLLRRARRDAGGRELRGLAYRMGVAG